jgi:heme/copper-type cytochrome/quinol oxidase subunit 3
MYPPEFRTLHVMSTAGASILAVGYFLPPVFIMAVFAARGAFVAHRHTPVEMLGLYWHFVDVIWIFLLPLLCSFGLSD